VWLSQRKLNQATTAYQTGNCAGATRDALSSISILSFRPEPYQVIAYCDIQRNFPRLAVQAMTSAVALERGNWNYSYGLALARAAAGQNPIAAAHRALVLDPREPLVQTEWRTFRTDTPARWPRDARTIADAFNSL
jgi:hypothetical protein